MSGKPTVLNTRPREQAAELSRLLRQAGFEAVDAPAIAIVDAWDAGELASVQSDVAAGLFDWVVLASLNSARGLEFHLPTARVVCGLATAEALGLQAEIQLARFSAAAALRTMRSCVQTGQRVLVPRAAEGRDEIVEGLLSLGVEVVAPVAYRTFGVDDAAQRLRDGGINIVTVCSPSAVQSIAGALPSGTPLVCIGETTASTARALGMHVEGIAANTSMRSLVAAVTEVAGSRV